jgi:hypothetical protein
LVVESLRVVVESVEDHSPYYVEGPTPSSPVKKRKARRVEDSDDDEDDFALFMSPSKKARVQLNDPVNND